MSDQSRIVTGFDCEFLIGGNYLNSIFAAAYRNGNMLDRDRLEDPFVAALLGQFSLAIDQYDICMRGIIEEDTFEQAVPGMNASMSTDLYRYLKEQQWLQNNTLTDAFDIEDPYLLDYIEGTYDDNQAALVAVLENASKQATIHIEEPSEGTIYDDNRSLMNILRGPLTQLSPAWCAALIQYLKEHNWADAQGCLAVELDTIRDDVEAWLDANIGDYTDQVLRILEQPPDLMIRIPLTLCGELMRSDGTMVTLDRWADMLLYVSIEITPLEIRIRNPILSEDSKCLLDQWGDDLGRPGIGSGLGSFIGMIIPDRFDASLTPNSTIRRIEFRKVAGTDGYVPAYGAFFNIESDLRVLPETDGQPCSYAVAANQKPIGMTGDTIELSADGNLVIKDQSGAIVAPEELRFGPGVNEPNDNSVLFHVLGNRHVKSIDIDEDGHLYAEYLTGFRPSPEDIVSLFKKNPPRGDASRALSFLKSDRDFVIGISADAIKRQELSIWNSFWQPTSDEFQALLERFQGSPLLPNITIPEGSRLMIDHSKEDKPTIGVYKSFELECENGAVVCDVNLRYFLEWWPDADVHCKIRLQPTTTQEDSLKIRVHVDELSADTGLLGDFLGFLLFGIVGIIIVEFTEDIMANQYEDQVEASASQQTGQLFSAIPRVIPLFKRKHGDITYKETFGPGHLYQEVQINGEGLAFSGRGECGSIIETVRNIKLVDRYRDLDSLELTHLVYANYAYKNSAIPVEELATRIKQGMLKDYIILIPEARYRRDGRIHSLRFESGIDLRIDEIIELMRACVISVPNVKIRVNRYGTQYLQSKPDTATSNNLGELPPFVPREWR